MARRPAASAQHSSQRIAVAGQLLGTSAL
jgi:hypothetical protein